MGMGQNWHIPHCGAAWTQCHGRDTQYLGQKAKKIQDNKSEASGSEEFICSAQLVM